MSQRFEDSLIGKSFKDLNKVFRDAQRCLLKNKNETKLFHILIQFEEETLYLYLFECSFNIFELLRIFFIL